MKKLIAAALVLGALLVGGAVAGTGGTTAVTADPCRHCGVT